MAKMKPVNIPCSFKGYSRNKTARLGVAVTRHVLTLDDADGVLSGSRCEVVLTLSDDTDQQQFDGYLPEPLKTVADIKRWAVTPEQITFGLTFNPDELDVQQLEAFINQSGSLKLTRIGSASGDEETEG